MLDIARIIERLASGRFWRKPIVSFCSADDTEVLPKIVPGHLVAEEVMPHARSIIVYFIPFSEKVVASNVYGIKPSRLWAEAYVATNKLIDRINAALTEKLGKLGYAATGIRATHNFDEVSLLSRWSHKHVAWLAGLGSFGMHTQIVTAKGCSGRLGSLVTEAELSADVGDEEYCDLCGECIDRCPYGALSDASLDRKLCYEVLLRNMELYPLKADVCGKCVCGVPCSLKGKRREV